MPGRLVAHGLYQRPVTGIQRPVGDREVIKFLVPASLSGVRVNPRVAQHSLNTGHTMC